MFDATRQRHIVSVWFPRLPSDRALRLQPAEGPFVLSVRAQNSDRVHCLNPAAERAGLHRGMALSQARAFCPDLHSRPADPAGDMRFLQGLRRWAGRYSPLVGLDGPDGLALDIGGVDHLFGGTDALLGDIRHRLSRAGLTVRVGLAATPAAAWAMSHYGDGDSRLADLPVAALRLDPDTVTALQRLGLRSIGDVRGTARAPLARRFGQGLLDRLDQLEGLRAESIAPLADQPRFAVRLTLPEPIGLVSDVMAGTGRLLERLCRTLERHGAGALALRLTLRRVDGESRHADLRLATTMRAPERILPLFAPGVEGVDAGFGIDQLRLEATRTAPMPQRQVTTGGAPDGEDVADLLTRLGTRVGLDNIRRIVPSDSHIPEHSFALAPSGGKPPPPAPRLRPHWLFPPEPVSARGPRPPQQFRWRRMGLTSAEVTGPERICPEWWRPDRDWPHGIRDYWRIETRQGPRLWMFHTPQNPAWFVQGEFA
ncbi:Y-family DNA polymerase [Paracoccus fontiphilus]|uniref:Y-family DNA polymerase n=1 Tax=Paracoccus fontiphilus TaxID=1815556 RepID=A0ABV7IBT0_9RHOB|nr:DNA polymerase Y family protein [Paracoccus fontiphilus]